MPQSVDGDIRLSVSFNLEAKDVKREAQNLKEILAKTLNSGAGKGNPQLEKMMTQMQKSYFTIEKLQDKMKALESNKVPTAQYKDLETELDSLRRKTDELAEAREKWANTTGTGKYFAQDEIAKIDAEFDKIIAKIEELEKKKRELESSGGAFTIANPEALNQVMQQLNFATRQAENFQQKFKEATSGESGAESMKRSMQEFSAITKKAFNGAKSAAKSFGRVAQVAINGVKKAISGIKSTINSVKDGFSKLKDSAKNAFKHVDKSATRGLKNLLRYGLGIRGLFMLFRKLRGYATDAFKGIAQQSSSFNKTMSNITNTFAQFKGSIGTALQPLITIVEPILIRIMNLFINAANAVGSFFATLTGQKYIYKAVKANNSYADSISGTGKAAKEANKQLAEYDKLMVIQQDNASDAGSGGAGGGGGFTEELVDPSNSVSQFAQDLKDAWENQNFAAIGEIVGEKINELTSKIKEAISWDNVGPEIEQFMQNWGTAFNSLVSTVDWQNIGSTVATGLNTITNTVESFIDNFNLDELGTALAEAFNGFNVDFDWENLGETISKGLNEISSAVNNFQDNGNWKDLGTNFASAMNSLVDGVNGEELGKALSAKFKIMLDAANGFVHEFKWDEAGSTLSDIVEGWYGNIDWDELGDTVATGMNGISDAIISFTEDTNWEKMGKDLGSGFSTFVKKFDGEKFGKALSSPIQALNDSLTGLLSNFEEEGTWAEAGKDIGDTINGWFDGINWEQLATNITTGADGLVESIQTAISTTNWEKIGSDIGTLINGAVNIDWKEVGKTASLGVSKILDGLSSLLETVDWKTFGEDVADFICGIEWGEVFASAISVSANLVKGIDGFVTGFRDKFAEGIKKFFTDGDWRKEHLGKPIGEAISEALGIDSYWITDESFESLKLALMQLWNNAMDYLIEKKPWMKWWYEIFKIDQSKIDEQAAELKSKLDKALEEEFDTFDIPVEVDLKGDITSLEEAWKNLNSKDVVLQAEAKEKTKGALEKIESDWNAIMDKNPEMSTEAKEKIKGALKDLKDNWDKVNDKDPVLAAEAKEKVANALKTLKGDWTAIDNKNPKLEADAKEKTHGALKSLKEGWDGIVEKTKQLLTDAKEKTAGALKSLKDTWDGIKEKTKELWLETKEKVKGALKDFKSKWDDFKSKTLELGAKLAKGVKDWFLGLWDKFKSWFKSGAKKDGGKLEVGAKNATDKKEVGTWWDKLKGFWGKKNLSVTGEMKVTKATLEKGVVVRGNAVVDLKSGGNGGHYTMATGGIVNHRLNNVTLGENGPEAVIPLKNNTEWLDIVSKYVFAHMNIGKIDIPHLAKGQVIPPNRQFLAMLGDQKSGTNVEAPLKTIEQALENVLNKMSANGSSAPIILQLDGRQIAQAVWNESDKRYKQTGKAFAY